VQVTGPVWVMLENVPGARADIRAKVVDFNETGIRIHISLLLRANHIVVIKCQAVGVVPNGKAIARVVDCRALMGSGYTAGLTFERASDEIQIQLGSNQNTVRTRIFEQSEAAAIKEWERAKRRGILELLYAARRKQPSQATVGIHELERLLGCPRERLDFSLWYLQQNALVATSETGALSITAKGVDHLEAESSPAACISASKSSDHLCNCADGLFKL
jgi:predicted transcriptional regulator